VPTPVKHRRRILAAAVSVVALSAACGQGGSRNETTDEVRRAASAAATHAATATPTPTPPPPPELPRGGRILFPTYRLVGYCGSPGSPALGRLDGDLDAVAVEIEKLAAEYAAGRQPQPVFELIATIAHGVRGDDGMYRTRLTDDVIKHYLEAARRHRAMLLLNIQPGRADFLPEVQAYERWLREPDVGVALDPEWAVEPGQVPGRVYGRTTGAELDAVATYLSGLVAQGSLPEKPMVFHQVSSSVVRDEALLQPKPGVVIIRSVDGIGAPAAKLTTWTKLTAQQPPHIRGGFKLFYTEDAEEGPLMTPPEVLSLVPEPEYVMFE
jgi:hypothetical protein